MNIDTSRQQLINGMSDEKQAVLRHSRALIIGAGGLATTALSYLTMAGVESLTIVDFDHIEASNLHRQTLYTPSDLGRNKAEAAKDYLNERAPNATIKTIVKALNNQELTTEIKAHDIVLDCTDNRLVSFQINDCAMIAHKPVIFANASEMSGQLFTMIPKGKEGMIDNHYSNFRSIWPGEEQHAQHNKEKLGVIGPVPGVMGSLQALEAIKVLTEFSPICESALLHIDFRTLSIQKIKIVSNKV